jgi:hypothetical protein
VTSFPLRLRRCALGTAVLAASAGAQLPRHPENLQVLPKTMSTDSVFALMLRVADGLGVSCGYCHVGGDNPTWDSTHFASDVIPKKVTARAMFRLTNRLNEELLPAMTNRSGSPVTVTCMTCHRGAPRPVTLEDTLTRILDRQGADSAVAAYARIRERYAGRMTYDLTQFPLIEIGSRLVTASRFRDAVKILELGSRQFPNSADVAYQLGVAYEKVGERLLAIAQFQKVLSLEPGDQRADQHLRALTGSPKRPSGQPRS